MTIALLTEDGPSGEAIRILAEKCLTKTGRSSKIIRRCINRGDIFTNPRKLAALVKQVNVREQTKIILENECRPESILKEIYRKHGKSDFNKSRDDIIIANHADPDRIAKRCGSFKKFQQILLS